MQPEDKLPFRLSRNTGTLICNLQHAYDVHGPQTWRALEATVTARDTTICAAAAGMPPH